MMEKPRSKLIGERACFICTLPVRVYAQKNGHLGYTCQSPGCRCQVIGKSEKGNVAMIAGITHWFSQEDRAAYLGTEAKPAAPAKPARAQKSAPVRKPAPAPAPEDREARTRRELFGE